MIDLDMNEQREIIQWTPLFLYVPESVKALLCFDAIRFSRVSSVYAQRHIKITEWEDAFLLTSLLNRMSAFGVIFKKAKTVIWASFMK